jgi:hypothetical protein
MWRSFFLAVGLCVFIVGLECLVIDDFQVVGTSGGRSVSRQFTPPDWAPWSLMSVGAVTVLYSFTIPQRIRGG